MSKKKIHCPQCGVDRSIQTGKLNICGEVASAEFQCFECSFIFWVVYSAAFITVEDSDGVCRKEIELKK